MVIMFHMYVCPPWCQPSLKYFYPTFKGPLWDKKASYVSPLTLLYFFCNKSLFLFLNIPCLSHVMTL